MMTLTPLVSSAVETPRNGAAYGAASLDFARDERSLSERIA